MSILSRRTSRSERALRTARKKARTGARKSVKGARSARGRTPIGARPLLGVLTALSAVIFLRRRSAKTEVPSYTPPESYRSTPTPGDTSIAGSANGGAAPLAAVHTDSGEHTPPHGDAENN